MSSLQLSLPQSAHSIISTSTHHLKTKQYDSRSYAAKTLELQFGFIIEDYITKGKERFKQYIEEHRKFCGEFIKKDEPKRGNSHKMKEIKVQYRIWTLLLHLFNSKTIKNNNHRHNNNNNNNNNTNYYFNPKQFIADKFNEDYKLRKLEHIILWLQDITSIPYYLNNGNISYTRTINQNNSTRNPKLKSLDPDVMTRMNIDINNLSKPEINDLNDEEKLLNIVFHLIRKGKWDEATNLCRAYGCHYRAASINGRQLFYDACSMNDVNGIGGNSEYLMWLKICYSISENTKSLPEKWIYSTLCGNIDRLLTYVNENNENENNYGNWYDLLWVLTICKQIYIQYKLLTNKLPSYYYNNIKNKNCNINNIPIIKSNWEDIFTDFNTMFDWIEKTNRVINDNMNKEDNDNEFISYKYNFQYYKICKFIICEQYEQLLISCSEFINNQKLKEIKNGITIDFMRFIIHLYLHLNPHIAQKNNSSFNELFIKFIIKYIELLKDNKNYEQVVRYCFILPKPQLVSTLTEFFLSLNNIELRNNLIGKAKHILPNDIIYKISGNIAKNIIDQCVSDNNNNEWKQIVTIQTINIDDLHKIDSLTCLKIIKENNNEILYRTNQLFTMFAKEYKFDGIIKLFNDIYHIINININNINVSEKEKLQCHYNTYECYSLYKSVIDSYNTWNKYHLDINIHRNEKEKNIKLVTKFIRNMLLYKYGWLNPRYCAVQQLNFKQINEIRSIILERLLDILYVFINNTKQYDFCLELTTIIADEKYSYYKLFDTQDKKVIKKLLNNAKDSKIQIIKYQQEMQRRQQQFT